MLLSWPSMAINVSECRWVPVVVIALPPKVTTIILSFAIAISEHRYASATGVIAVLFMSASVFLFHIIAVLPCILFTMPLLLWIPWCHLLSSWCLFTSGAHSYENFEREAFLVYCLETGSG